MGYVGVGGLCSRFGVRLCSGVFTEWNCVWCTCALCWGLVTSVLLMSFSGISVLVSCFSAVRNWKKFLLFLSWHARKVAMCLHSTNFAFLTSALRCFL